MLNLESAFNPNADNLCTQVARRFNQLNFWTDKIGDPKTFATMFYHNGLCLYIRTDEKTGKVLAHHFLKPREK